MDSTPKRLTRRHVTGLSVGTAAILSVGAASALIGRCSATSAGTRTSGSQALVSVKDFGAAGDGSANDSAAIVAADASAAALGMPLFFPHGRYAIDLLKATTSWIGEGKDRSILAYRGHIASFANLVTATGVDDIRFVDLGFDGCVSQDPASWNATNLDRFSGAAGLSVEECSGAVILRCSAVNTRQHGFRFLKVRGGLLDGCSTRRSRGNFGDGFLILSSTDVSAVNCVAEDYTRIGIVADRMDVTQPFCQRIILRDCRATNGHDASSLYGGREFNAGVWMENCADAILEGVRTRDNRDRGISICSGQRTADLTRERATFTLRDCECHGGTFGLYAYSLGDLPVSVTMTDCSARGVLIGFDGSASLGEDRFTWTGCHAEYNASAVNGRGFATEVTSAVNGKPSFEIGKGCTVDRWVEDPAKLEDSGHKAATADIGSFYFPAGAMRLTIDGVRHVDGNPVYIRWYNNWPHEVRVIDVDAVVPKAMRTGVTLFSENATFRTRRSDMTS